MITTVHAETKTPSGIPNALRSDRIRVIQFLANFCLGGTERLTVDLARALAPSRYDLAFGCLLRWGELLSEVADRGIPIREYRIAGLYTARAWRERWRFTAYLRRHPVQVVHAYNFYANAFATLPARFARVPVVLASIQDTGGYLTPLQQRVQRYACRLAHRIVVNAEAVKRYLIAEGFPEEKLVVLPQGIDASRFGGPPDGRLRQEMDVPPQAPLVAVLSRLIPLKGIEYFLDAVALIAPRRPEARFLVVGDHYLAGKDGMVTHDFNYRSALERHAERLGLNGRVIFTGFRTDIPEILSNVTVSVLPSVGGEGLSNALLEAMASSVPIVATDVGGNAEAVVDGTTGFVVPPRNAPALADAIDRLLGDSALATRFGAAGKERVARLFSTQHYAQQIETLYTGLLDGFRRRARVR